MKNSLNKNIKELRIQSGMNQIALAKALSVSKQCVSNWKNDNVQPSIDMLVKLANLFCVSTDQLLGRNTARTINVSDLTEEQAVRIRWIVNDLSKNNRLHLQNKD